MGTVTTNETGAVPDLDELASRLRFSYDNGRISLETPESRAEMLAAAKQSAVE